MFWEGFGWQRRCFFWVSRRFEFFSANTSRPSLKHPNPFFHQIHAFCIVLPSKRCSVEGSLPRVSLESNRCKPVVPGASGTCAFLAHPTDPAPPVLTGASVQFKPEGVSDVFWGGSSREENSWRTKENRHTFRCNGTGFPTVSCCTADGARTARRRAR